MRGFYTLPTGEHGESEHDAKRGPLASPTSNHRVSGQRPPIRRFQGQLLLRFTLFATLFGALAISAEVSYAQRASSAAEGATALTSPRADSSPATSAPNEVPSDMPPEPPATTLSQSGSAQVASAYDPTESAHISLTEAVRFRALDNSLSSLAARGSSVFGAVATIVAGAGSVALGGLFHRDTRSLARYLYLWGASGVARGIVEIALRPTIADDELAYSHMPMRSTSEVAARLAFGEASLRRAAHRARLSRMLDGGIAVLSGLLVIPVYFVPTDFSFSDPLAYFALLGGGLNVITGTISFLSRSRAERRLSAYEDLTLRLEREHADVNLAPLRGGFVATGTWSF